MNKFINTLKIKFFNRDSVRSQKILKNTIFSFGIKSGSIIVSLLLVPITIDFINPTAYGVWLTLSSIVGWIALLDIGLGNGLKNLLGESLAHNDIVKSKIYVSTTYAILTIMSISFFFIFKIINHYLNWYDILKISEKEVANLSLIVDIIIASVCIQFVVKLLNTILSARQEPARSDFLIFLGQFIVLSFIYIFQHYSTGSLFKIVWILTMCPILVLLISSFYYYSKSLKLIAPSYKSIDLSYAKNLLKIGGVFFFIQIGVIVVFQTDNIIITRVLGAEKVTEFNVSYKLFSIVYLVFSIVATPYWSAFTDAYVKKDFDWMKNSIKMLRRIWLIFTFAVLPILYFLSDFLFRIWVGNKVGHSRELSITMCIYVSLLCCLLLSMNLINGVGKIRLQFYLYLFAAIINIPLGIYLGKNFGLVGVTFSNIIIFAIMNVFIWIQTDKILHQTDKGIWSK